MERGCRGLRVPAGEADLEPGDPATMPLTASAALLLDAILADFECRLRGGMAAAAVQVFGPTRVEIVGFVHERGRQL